MSATNLNLWPIKIDGKSCQQIGDIQVTVDHACADKDQDGVNNKAKAEYSRQTSQ